ncbi:MAG: fumarylacetoacetate hydrolase family protein [Ignavibacteriae bacterium]|nr:fumarylacetoacetate hydrolase family protein [Ignavibacteria bacterium]MBI3363590.1 fumarylacetoacetate hydrolase family protein [Ignavibacteriota bacterium]
MKLCTFEVKTVLGKYRRIGAVTEQGVIDLNSAFAWHLHSKGEAQPYRLANALVPSDMLSFLQGEVTSTTFAQATIEHVGQVMKSGKTPLGLNEETLVFNPAEVKLKAPLPHPTSVRDFYAFEQHVKKGFEKRGEPMPPEWYEIPVYYKSAHWSIIGSDEDVQWPSFTEKFDYELELAIIIGKSGRNISENNAKEYIAGFTIMNDFSARDIQRKEMKVRLGPAKGKDFATAIGPILVTPEELGDPYSLRMTATINGELWSDGNSGSIYHSFEKMIAFASLEETLYPGDVIGSGTVGTGCGLELDRWVKPGDVIELEIEKIGVLRNRVVKAVKG